MNYFLERKELKSPIRNKKKQKLLKGHIFQELTINENLKGNDIKTKISNINNEEISDLKLIDIHFIQKNILFSQELNSSRGKHSNRTFRNKLNKKLLINNSNNKKEIKIFPNIPLHKKISKSNEKINITDSCGKNENNNKNKNLQLQLQLNDEEKKLFMTKLDNIKKYKNSYKTYSNHFFNISSQNNNNNNKSEDNNKTCYYFNKTHDKYNQNTNKYLTEYQPKYINRNNIILENKNKKYINNTEFQNFSKVNNINKISLDDIQEKDDKVIFKQLKKNKELSKFIKNRKKYRRNDINLFINNRNNNSYNKKILNKNNNIIKISNNNTPNRINNFNQINFDNKKHEKIKSLENKTLKLNLNINDNNLNIDSDIKINNISSINNLIDNQTFLNEFTINSNLLKNLKYKEKLKRYLYTLKVNNLEKDFNKNFEDINNKFKNQKIRIEKMKKRCKSILEELDKKINFNLEEFIKEYEREDLGINFIQFFNYLLMLLVNYDKKIIPNTFVIKKESKEQSEDVKYCTVLKKHIEFMNLLDKQYNEGKYANKLLKKFLLKREEELKKNN